MFACGCQCIVSPHPSLQKPYCHTNNDIHSLLSNDQIARDTRLPVLSVGTCGHSRCHPGRHGDVVTSWLLSPSVNLPKFCTCAEFQIKKIRPKRKFSAGRPCGHPAKKFGQALQILEKQAFWHGHTARTSTPKVRSENFGLIFRSLEFALHEPKRPLHPRPTSSWRFAIFRPCSKHLGLQA